MTLKHISARIRRLDSLFIGLHREISKIARGDDPMLYLERQAYLKALYSTTAALENARVILARARRRIESSGGGGGRPSSPRGCR
jgi:hypothetical protein